MVGIIIAMDKELAPLTEGRKTVKTEEGGKEFYRFDVDGVECVAVKSGIGKVNAAYATTLLVRGFRPDYLVSTGISGGLGRHGLLELVAAERTVQYDVDTTALGDPIGYVSTVNKVYFDADERLTDVFCKATGAKRTVLACGDRFVADDETKNFIVTTFDAGACDMESGAIAQIAFITGTPYVALRCISDGAGDGAEYDYEKTASNAAKILSEALRAGIKAVETGNLV